MVDFENAEAVAQCGAVRPGVQPGAEHYNLPDSAFHGGRQGILRESVPHSDEDSHPSSGWVLLSLASNGPGIFTKNAQGKWICENAALFQDLMGGTVKRCAPSRPAWLSQLHNY